MKHSVADKVCFKCNKRTSYPLIRQGYCFCTNCWNLEHSGESMNRRIKTKRYGEVLVHTSDRFLWHTYKWFVLQFLDDKHIVIRLEGTPDVTVLPEDMVAQMVYEYMFNLNYVK